MRRVLSVWWRAEVETPGPEYTSTSDMFVKAQRWSEWLVVKYDAECFVSLKLLL